MDNPGIYNSLLFLTDSLVTIYTLALIARGVFSLVRADFYNPVSQFIFKVTEPPLSLLRRFVPLTGRWDTPCWLLVWLLSVLEVSALSLLQGLSPPVPLLVFVGTLSLVELLLQFYIGAIFLLALSSWFIGAAQAVHPLYALLHSVTQPVLDPFRRFMPSAGGLDFTPLVALLVLYFLLNFVRSIY